MQNLEEHIKASAAEIAYEANGADWGYQQEYSYNAIHAQIEIGLRKFAEIVEALIREEARQYYQEKLLTQEGLLKARIEELEKVNGKT